MADRIGTTLFGWCLPFTNQHDTCIVISISNTKCTCKCHDERS